MSIFMYTIIASLDDNESIKLSAGIEEDGRYFMPSLTMKIEGKESVYWDNEDYIFGKFYKFLKRWNNEDLEEEDITEFADIWELLTKEWVKDMIEILDKGIELKWNKL